jgi:phytoene desaturase
MRTVVIGGGLAGLAAAIRLAAAGCRVTLCEANRHLGGKMNTWDSGGFHFDMGPTILTMPSVLERLFGAAGRRMEEYLTLVPLDPQWRAWFADGTRLDLASDPERMRAGVERFSPGEGDAYRRFLAYARQMYQVSADAFFWRPYGSLWEMLRASGTDRRGMLRVASSIDPLTTMHGAIRRHFSDGRLVQLFEHFVQYVGSSPFTAPAILTLIPYVQLGLGCWYPMGGTGEIARALERLLEELGVEVRLEAPVARVLLDGRRATGVALLDGEVIAADAVVTNSDVARTYGELIDHPRARAFVRSQRRRLEPACSGVVLYLGCRRAWPELLHHSFFFARDPHREFHDLYDRRIPTLDPTLYVCVPSVTDPAVAPPGGSSVYVLVHTPYRTQNWDWQSEGDAYREFLLQQLEERGMPGLRESIVTERMLTPLDIERIYRSVRGSIYGIVTRRGLASAFKPGNRCPLFSGLYFCGGSSNPGAGVPMVLMSGQIAAECLLKDAAPVAGPAYLAAGR